MESSMKAIMEDIIRYDKADIPNNTPLARPTVVPPGDIIFFKSITYFTSLTFCKTSLIF